MHLAISILFWLLAIAVLFTTLAPMTGSVQWWIRGWDFPRVHITALAVLTALIGLWVFTPTVLFFSAIMVSCAAYQVSWIFPYTPFAHKEISFEKDVTPETSVSLLSVNVLMENQDHERLRGLIDREDPDVLLLMEVDSVWEEALADQLDRYTTVVRHPLSNHYGMIFATRLKANAAKTVFLSDDDTPTLLADLDAPTGRFFFVGLHPQPPVPGTDTEARDEQIKKSALLADRTVLPVVAMGDFNDVAWSWSSMRFKTYGAFRDPRVGRGILPSFDATSWLMRFPIDQLYLTDGLGLVSFERLEDIGSDHYPMKAVITVQSSQ